MRHGRTVGVVLALMVVFVLSPISAAAPSATSACDLNSGNCVGYTWGGSTSQASTITDNITLGAISFVTDLSKSSIGHLQWDVIGEHCASLPGRTVPIAGTDSRHAYPVAGGHVSITETYIFPLATRAKLPGVLSHLTGTLSGTNASGKVQWSLTGPYKSACTPSSGSFTWHAVNQARIATA